jgi:hypothetical protein
MGTTPPHSFFGVVTSKNLILLGRRFLPAVYQIDSKVDAGIYFVLLLVRVVHKWVAVIYLHSKLKLSLNHIPKYLRLPPGSVAPSSVLDRVAGLRDLVGGNRLFFRHAEDDAFEKAAVGGC